MTQHIGYTAFHVSVRLLPICPGQAVKISAQHEEQADSPHCIHSKACIPIMIKYDPCKCDCPKSLEFANLRIRR